VDLMDILRWHVEELTPKRSESDLLFPPRWGDGFMSASALDKPFKEARGAHGLGQGWEAPSAGRSATRPSSRPNAPRTESASLLG
jgi:hypothetical protein